MKLLDFMPWGLSVALLSVRMTVALALSPALAAYGVPAVVRMTLVVMLATLTFTQREAAPAAVIGVAQPASLPMSILAEVLIGALLGLGVQIVFAALALAGRVMDVQIGFAIGSVFDPVSGAHASVLGSLTALLGVTLFMASDAHLQLANLIALSIDLLPLGHIPQLADPMQPLLAAGAMFSLGLALAAPVVGALLLTDVAIGVASRNMPQVNVLVLAMPLKVLIGYYVLALSIIGWSPLAQQAFELMARRLGVG